MTSENTEEKVVVKNADGWTVTGTSGNDKLTATHGDDTITGGAGDDLIKGWAGADILNGTDDVHVGAGEQDTIISGQGDFSDTIILGNESQAYYAADGDADYALIKGLTETDVLVLHGTAADYTFTQIDGDRFPSVEIRLVEGNELIAVVQRANPENLLVDYLGDEAGPVPVVSPDEVTDPGDTPTDGYGDSSDDPTAQVFILGDAHEVFYDEAGEGDFLLIANYKSGDEVQLHGHADDYTFVQVGSNVEIRLNDGNELIAVIENSTVDGCKTQLKFKYLCKEVKDPQGTIGDTIFLDTDGDGTQAADEDGIANVTVQLIDKGADGELGGGDDTIVATDATDANGNYLFDNLDAGDYAVIVTDDNNALEGLTQTADPDIILDSMSMVTLAQGEDNLDQDFGYQPDNPPALASLGDTVFHDLDADGIQDANEPGISGATVNLLDAGGTQIGTTTTDNNGNYAFTDLAPGDYTVEFETPDGFSESSPANVGGDDAIDSDGPSVSTTLEAGENDTTLDSGFYNLASLGDVVFFDQNGNGIQDGGDSFVEGVIVNLLQNGQVVETALTDFSGSYLFDNLQPGNYQVEFVPPDDLEFTAQDVGNDDTIDSDAGVDGLTEIVTLQSGDNNLTLDAGLVDIPDVLPTITVDKLNDANDDGTFTDNEETTAGDSVTFQGSVTNTSTEDVVITAIADDLHQTGINASSTAQALIGSTLAAGETATFTFEGTIADEDDLTEINTLSVTVVDPEGNEASDSDTSTVTTPEPQVELVCLVETTFSEQLGASDEAIEVQIAYEGDFNGDGLDDIFIKLRVADASNSGTEDMLGVAFDIGGNAANDADPNVDNDLINNLGLTIDDIATYANGNPGTSDQLVGTPADGTDYLLGPDAIDPPPPNFLGINVSGGGVDAPYDSIVKFGDGGQSDGVVQEASFIIAGNQDLTAALVEQILEDTDWYVRLQSTDGGEESAKTGGFIDALNYTAVPIDSIV